MKGSSDAMGTCMRCGNCCTQFGVCITPFDIRRIAAATGMKAEEFVAVIDVPRERERHEPAVMISGRPSLLVLKWRKDRICMFYEPGKCGIYDVRPMLCRTYPFVLTRHEIADIPGRVCPRKWAPEHYAIYGAYLEQYRREVELYRAIAEAWNRGRGGSLGAFLRFAMRAAPPQPPDVPSAPAPPLS